jgi:hypothetical protein
MAVVLIVILAVLALVTVKGSWPYLWREWLTSVDHKRIGVMYVILGLVMLLRGYSDAIMMRTQQAIAIGDAQGYHDREFIMSKEKQENDHPAALGMIEELCQRYPKTFTHDEVATRSGSPWRGSIISVGGSSGRRADAAIACHRWY